MKISIYTTHCMISLIYYVGIFFLMPTIFTYINVINLLKSTQILLFHANATKQFCYISKRGNSQSQDSQPTNPIFLSPLIRSQMFNNSSKNIKFNKWPLWLVEAKAKPGEVQFMEGRLNGNHATTPQLQDNSRVT